MASSSAGSSSASSAVIEFCSITGASQSVGEELLKACNGNLEMAIGMHMDTYSNDESAAAYSCEESDVRAPIPQKHEVLIKEQFHSAYTSRRRVGRGRGARSVFDGLRDFQAETKQHELKKKESLNSYEKAVAAKKKTLEELFRPPIEIMFKGSFEAAKESGSANNKWLIINIQNSKEFSCQTLNRDVWSNISVQNLIEEHFIFLQIYHDSEDGVKFMQFYNVPNWPYLAVLDPRTGELLVSWKVLDSPTFIEVASDFLTKNPAPDTKAIFDAHKSRNGNKDNICDANEDSQLEAAIKMSLKETTAKVCEPYEGDSLSMDCVQDDETDESEIYSEVEEDLETFSGSDAESGCENIKLSKSTYTESGHASTDLGSSNFNKSCTAKRKYNECSDNMEDTRPCKLKPQSSFKNDSLNGNYHNIDSNHSILNEKSSNITANSQKITTIEKSCNNDIRKDVQSWKFFLGKNSDPALKLMIRYPDNSREPLTIPQTSKLKSVTVYVGEKGYNAEKYELITTFPLRNLSDMDQNITFDSIGFGSSDSIFVQER